MGRSHRVGHVLTFSPNLKCEHFLSTTAKLEIARNEWQHTQQGNSPRKGPPKIHKCKQHAAAQSLCPFASSRTDQIVHLTPPAAQRAGSTALALLAPPRSIHVMQMQRCRRASHHCRSLHARTLRRRAMAACADRPASRLVAAALHHAAAAFTDIPWPL